MNAASSLRLCFLLMCVASGTLSQAHGDEVPSALTTAEPGKFVEVELARESHRTIYFARNSSVRNLVYLLEKHFDGDSGVKFVAEPNGNLLSIRANSPVVLEDVLKTLAQIDRPLRQIAIQALVVEFNSKMADGSDVTSANLPVDTDELAGSASDALNTLKAWGTAGHLANVRRYELKALENNSSELFLGEDKPIVSSYVTNRVSGTAQPLWQYRSFGTSLNVTPRINEGDSIDVSLRFFSSRPAPQERNGEQAALPVEQREPASTATSRLETTLSVPNGKTNVVTSFQDGEKSGRVPMLLVISAHIVDLNKPVMKAAIEPTQPAAPSRPTTSQVNRPGNTIPAAEPPPANRDANSPAAVNTPPRRRPRSLLRESQRNQEFATRLKLTEQQQQKFNELRDDLRAAMSTGITSEEVRQGVFERTKEISRKALDVLTDEQKKIWDDHQKEIQDAANAPAVVPPQPQAAPPSTEPNTSSGRGARENRALTPTERLAELNERIRTNPSKQFQLRRRAEIYLELGQMGEAIADLRAAIASSPNPSSIQAKLAMLFAYQRDEAGLRELTAEIQKQLKADSLLQIRREVADVCSLMPEYFENPTWEIQLLEASVSSPAADGLASLNPSMPNERRRIDQSRLDLLRGQNLVAVRGLQDSLSRIESSEQSDKELLNEVRLRFAIALKSIGDARAAEAMVQTVESCLDSPPVTFASLSTHILLRQAQSIVNDHK